ncbi:MAG: hypothetical protein LBF41_00520 [Deltaproteobacteria bacterium]|jgi:uncharacterized membrane protein|nr:hypothetical protein [Deltaproteobacteria bacterium]
MDPQFIGSLFESLMLVAFGFAWPANIIHSVRRKSSVGKNLPFLVIVITGYVFGILAKFASREMNYVLFFYFANLAMVSVDLFLYFHYGREEKRRKENFPAA